MSFKELPAEARCAKARPPNVHGIGAVVNGLDADVGIFSGREDLRTGRGVGPWGVIILFPGFACPIRRVQPNPGDSDPS